MQTPWHPLTPEFPYHPNHSSLTSTHSPRDLLRSPPLPPPRRRYPPRTLGHQQSRRAGLRSFCRIHRWRQNSLRQKWFPAHEWICARAYAAGAEGWITQGATGLVFPRAFYVEACWGEICGGRDGPALGEACLMVGNGIQVFTRRKLSYQFWGKRLESRRYESMIQLLTKRVLCTESYSNIFISDLCILWIT